MPYVSARYASPPVEGARNVIATDEQGVEWSLTDASEVGDWLRFKEAGGIIDPYVAPAPVVRETSSPPQYSGEVPWQ